MLLPWRRFAALAGQKTRSLTTEANFEATHLQLLRMLCLAAPTSCPANGNILLASIKTARSASKRPLLQNRSDLVYHCSVRAAWDHGRVVSVEPFWTTRDPATCGQQLPDDGDEFGQAFNPVDPSRARHHGLGGLPDRDGFRCCCDRRRVHPSSRATRRVGLPLPAQHPRPVVSVPLFTLCDAPTFTTFAWQRGSSASTRRRRILPCSISTMPTSTGPGRRRFCDCSGHVVDGQGHVQGRLTDRL